MKYFFSAGSMNTHGQGYMWHKLMKYKFPNFDVVSKTITLNPKQGHPFAVVPLYNSVFNKVALHNNGIYDWIYHYNKIKPNNLIASIAGSDEEIEYMIHLLNPLDIKGIELNFSCPNHSCFMNDKIPNNSKHPLYLKLNYLQDPYKYDLNNIRGVRLNSIPIKIGNFTFGGSGKIAQKNNWDFIKTFKELNIAGCSFTCKDDIDRLEQMGCSEMGIGSILLTNPKLIINLNKEK